MMRSAFSALGINLTLWGAGLFYVEAVTLKAEATENVVFSMLTESSGRTVPLAPWLPYTLMGVGIVTILYAIALPRTQSAQKR